MKDKDDKRNLNTKQVETPENSGDEKATRKARTPTRRSRRYTWKESIFGRGYPDLCALREGPYYPERIDPLSKRVPPT
jgi:hypothetical protein